MKVTVSTDDIAAVAGFMATPLTMPTSATIADWLKDPAMREACAAAERILAALKGEPEAAKVTCPWCQSAVPAPDGALGAHVGRTIELSCPGSGWTVKGEHQ